MRSSRFENSCNDVRLSYKGKNKGSAGFTLLEVLLALVLLTSIVMVTWRSLDGLMRTRQLLDDQRAGQAIANAVILRMTRELQLADESVPLLPFSSEPDPSLAGRKMLGTHQTIGSENSADSISFMARSGAQYTTEGGSVSSVVKITYRTAKDPEQPDSRDSTLYLIRDETPNIRPLEKALARTMTFPITNRLVSLRFRYYDSEQPAWVGSWDTEAQAGLPAMIEFSVELKSPLGKISRFTTAVPIRGEEKNM